MGIEKRGGDNNYFYAKERSGARVFSRYLGKGETAKIMAAADEDYREQKQYEKERQREADRRSRDEYERTGAELQRALSLIQSLTRAALVASGHHKHKGQWRKGRKHAAATGREDSNPSKA